MQMIAHFQAGKHRGFNGILIAYGILKAKLTVETSKNNIDYTS